MTNSSMHRNGYFANFNKKISTMMPIKNFLNVHDSEAKTMAFDIFWSRPAVTMLEMYRTKIVASVPTITN